MIGPVLEGERRIWAVVAFGALGLLIAAVAGLMLWGAGRGLWDELRGVRRWSLRWVSNEPRRMVTVEASARSVRSALAEARGTLRSVHGLEQGPMTREPRAVDAVQRAFAQCLSLGYVLGIVGLEYDERRSWRFDGGGGLDREVARENERTMLCELVTRRAPAPELQQPLEQLAALLPASAAAAVPVRQLWSGLAAGPDAELALRRALTTMKASASLEDATVEEIEGLVGDELR